MFDHLVGLALKGLSLKKTRYFYVDSKSFSGPCPGNSFFEKLVFWKPPDFTPLLPWLAKLVFFWLTLVVIAAKFN